MWQVATVTFRRHYPINIVNPRNTHVFVSLFSGLSSSSLSSSSSSSSSLVGSSVVYQSGDTALLPCDVSVPVSADPDSANGNADELRLIMWYREDVKSPIYREERHLSSSKRVDYLNFPSFVIIAGALIAPSI